MAYAGSARALLNGGYVNPCAQASTFLTRTSALDRKHINAYTILINGLVADGVWSLLDVLYIFATQNSTTALLNLVSSSFNATINGGPTFSLDRGFLGVDSSTTVYLDTGFNDFTAGGNYTTTAAHISAWSNTNTSGTAGGGCLMGVTSVAIESDLFLKPGDSNAYFRINDVTGSGANAITSTAGHFLANRSDGTHSQGYVNGLLFASPNQTNGALQNGNIYILARNTIGSGAQNGGGYQISMASIGGNLSATNILNFYNRLRTYMSIIGVP